MPAPRYADLMADARREFRDAERRGATRAKRSSHSMPAPARFCRCGAPTWNRTRHCIRCYFVGYRARRKAAGRPCPHYYPC